MTLSNVFNIDWSWAPVEGDKADFSHCKFNFYFTKVESLPVFLSPGIKLSNQLSIVFNVLKEGENPMDSPKFSIKSCTVLFFLQSIRMVKDLLWSNLRINNDFPEPNGDEFTFAIKLYLQAQ